MNAKTKKIMLLALLAGCGATAADEASGSFAESEKSLYSYNDSTTWPMVDIPVCWGSTTWNNASYAAAREEMRTLVEGSYGRVTSLRLLGWEACPSSNPAATIVINFDNGNGGLTYPGYNPSGATVINLGITGSNVRRRALMMHEFAHALGFDHEIDRIDQPSTSCLPVPADVPGAYHTPYDDRSITNSTYCTNSENLSAWDVVGLQRIYGQKPAGSLVGANNKCVDIANPGASEPTRETRTQAWDCLGNRNQTWALEGSRRFHAGGFAHGYLDVQWANSADGTPVWNWTDNPGPAQEWTLDSVQIVGMGDLCLSVRNNSWFVGQTLQLANCAADVAQQWHIRSSSTSGRTRIEGRSPAGQRYCVGMGVETAVLTGCDGAAAEDELLLHDRHIVSKSSRCLDVQWGSPDAGTPVWSWGCNWNGNAEAQFWKVRGAIRGLAGKCLDFDASSTIANGTAVQLWSCNGAPQQMWEYHF
ncbi:MAG: hypothetical protein RL385_4176 [Pseudomonadota bacterium]|jgi:hypothetical protein